MATAAPASSHQSVESAIGPLWPHCGRKPRRAWNAVLRILYTSPLVLPLSPWTARMKFRFPIVIIDEDYRSENTSGLGIRALAEAIVAEGFEVLGVTSYGDLSQFAQQQSRASAFILSIDLSL